MKRVVLGIFLSLTFLFAGAKNIPASPEIVQSGITIIDIRTKPEWIQTGIVKGAVPITFFDERGGYDAQKFLVALDGYVNKNEEFAIICRSGNRTTAVSKFLGELGYKVINLQGGVKHLVSQGYELSKYNP